ncbi:MAG: dihydrofolate reductase [Salinivirgaceae bacterium]|nr:dihydrofolate reductase [Salinivirgaceae bacterium]
MNNTLEENDAFKYLLEQFADLKIMRFKVPGFESLKPKQKELIYYLSEAALCGRDILFDQNYKHNLSVRRTNEAILNSFSGDKSTPDFKEFEVYAKRVWFSNGIHHHYSTDKFFPKLSQDIYAEYLSNCNEQQLPLLHNETVEQFTERIIPIIFEPQIGSKKIVLDASKDIIAESATNFYDGLTESEVNEYISNFKQPDEDRPLSIGLNSQHVKKNGALHERVYKQNGLYGKAIDKIVYWLNKAVGAAETSMQQKLIKVLIDYYRTGDLKTWDDFNVLWVQELESEVDFVNGFIENYGDPMGMKATWESIVNFKDIEATKRTEIISNNAQWFEDNAPIDPRFKKGKVKGVSAKVITVAQLGGDCYPSTPIGINLPNADWIRRDYGSKSVTIENISDAYHKAAQGNGMLEEFCYSQEEIELSKYYGSMASNLHVDLHECLGHGSGQLLPNTSSDALKNYSSALEEARADLFALYYIADEKLVEFGLIPNLDVAKTEYNGYIRNGIMTQLTRVQLGKDIEQAHMRNRQLVSQWCYEKGKDDNVIEILEKEGKTYIVINNYQMLRSLFGDLLAEIQRIKSEGDYEAGKQLVETYAVQVDQKLHKEVLDRFTKLNIAAYGGFINPYFKAVMKEGKITDVEIEYADSYSEQMLKYSKEYSYLPDYN